MDDGEYVGENNRNIEIGKSVTIIGKSKENTIINGESSGRLFNVTSTGRLTLINITFLNAHSTENGGTIYCDGGAVNIRNCIVKNSTADANGGVIYNNLGALNIEDTSFTNNSASDYGGVLYTLGTTIIKNSNFTGNVLTSKVTAIGACIATGGKIDLDGCLFSDCYTEYSSAGILNLGDATINNQILKIDNFQLRQTKIVVNDFEKYYGSSSKLSIKLVKDNNVPVSNEKLTVSLGGTAYTIKTDKNGIAKLTIKNKPKTYTAKITFKGNNYYVGSTKSIKVKIVKPTIKASKTTIRKKGIFTVTFKDANKKAIKNVKVKFQIKGKTYIRTTNSKGQAKLTMNLKAGKYTVKVGFKSTAKYGTTTLTKKIKVTK